MEIVKFKSNHIGSLYDMLVELENGSDGYFFKPHPFNKDYLLDIANNPGKDLYYVLIEYDIVVGYGMLRGWNEGYEVPSLGIAISQKARGKGFGKALMKFLHKQASENGSRKIRLKVSIKNTIAKNLYEKMGYVFKEPDVDYVVGIVDLGV